MGSIMNIKSLLLGSAAALAAVSGAQAADAIVAAAPEPMEYVKVCDAFGKGYFYIPGTETCLNVSGYVRWQLNWDKGQGWSSYGGHTNGYSTGNTFGRLEINAKNDSEVGTVYSFIRFTGAASGGFSSGYYAGIDAGAIGFEVGNFDTGLTRFLNYGFTDDGGSYGYMGNSYAQVQGKVGAFSYIAGVDDFTKSAGYTAGLYAGVKGGFDNFEGALVADYDIAAKSFGLRGYVQGKFDIVTLRALGIYNQSALSKYDAETGVKGFTLELSGKAQMTDKLFAAVDYSYNFDPKTWNVVGDLGWNVASGFDVLVSGKYWSTKNAGGFLRLQRSF